VLCCSRPLAALSPSCASTHLKPWTRDTVQGSIARWNAAQHVTQEPISGSAVATHAVSHVECLLELESRNPRLCRISLMRSCCVLHSPAKAGLQQKRGRGGKFSRLRPEKRPRRSSCIKLFYLGTLWEDQSKHPPPMALSPPPSPDQRWS
jgi:hypothetical protein